MRFGTPCRPDLASFSESGEIVDGAQTLQSIVRVRVVQVARPERRRHQCPPSLKFFDDRHMVHSDLADEKCLQSAAVSKVVDYPLESAQVDGILHETAAAMNSGGDLEGTSR